MESPFSHLFSTNYVPTDEEIRHIRIDLMTHTEELARLDERLRELSAQRAQLQSYVDSHKALISGPRRLPPEIVREIFVACLPTRRNPAMSPQEAPLLLCRICSAWRSIALSMPKLWSSLHISFDFILSKESRLPAVTRWLQLSAACPISLSINSDRRSPLSNFDYALRRNLLLTSLAKSSPRWRHVGVKGTNAQDIAEFKAPGLESFTFANDYSTFNLKLINFAKTHTLRALSIHAGMIDEVALLASPLAWNRLTHLTIQTSRGALSPHNVLVLLGRCTQLVSFHFTPKNDVPIESADSVSVPYLETFIIPASSFCSSSALDYLTKHLSMPQLRRFRVRTEPFARDGSIFLVSLGTRSPLIEELTLDLESLTSHSLPETLRSLPSPTTLIVYDSHNQASKHPLLAQLLACLTPGLHRILCPALQELVVSTLVTESELQKSTLDAFIDGRLEFTSAFRRLNLEIQRTQLHGYRRDVAWESWVSALVSEPEIQAYLLRGLNVSVVYKYSHRLDPPSSPWEGLSLGND
ncbi:hypothetical protein C8R45DRAFT_854876 [Mycena sanguinolenta]|nr:hypothetical protein C8R45DRAFT_854876 [Mycena sanguinolenta]